MADEGNAFGIEPKSVKVPVRCGDCTFFKRERTYDKPCNQLGMLKSSKTCRRFMPNPFELEFEGEDQSVISLLKTVRKIKSESLPLLASIINQEVKNRKNQDFKIGQKVYLRVYPDNYLSNFKSATVVGISKQYLYVRGRAGWAAMIYAESVYTRKAFEKLKEKLIKDGMLRDPKMENYRQIKKSVFTQDYEPPTIDSDTSHLRKSMMDRKTRKGTAGDSVRVRGSELVEGSG